jgi:hypothetical protein
LQQGSIVDELLKGRLEAPFDQMRGIQPSRRAPARVSGSVSGGVVAPAILTPVLLALVSRIQTGLRDYAEGSGYDKIL